MENRAFPTDEQNLGDLIENYLSEEWETVVADIARLVSVKSVQDDEVQEGAPFGRGPRQGLDTALDTAGRMGLGVGHDQGYLGWAELPGETNRQIAAIGHVDVVPAGEGWTVEPFALTRRDGWLFGRGVIDNKGPALVTLHALNCLKRAGFRPRCTVRMLFGTNEESGMRDVYHYLGSHEPPAFLFTPDADFPAGYGEKGQLGGVFRLPLPADGSIVELSGGMATNAVPSSATATIRAPLDAFPSSEGISCESIETGVRIRARGVGGHAAWPEETRSAIGVLANYLLSAGIGAEAERSLLRFLSVCAHDIHGEKLGIAASDEHFGPLTVISGTLRTESEAEGQNARKTVVLTIDARFPSTATAESLAAQLQAFGERNGATFAVSSSMPVFLIDPNSPAIQALLSSYHEVFDDAMKPFTMGGATYARCFPAAASFGPIRPWVARPSWAGNEHMADEAVSEATLKDAFRVYVRAFYRLAALDW